MMCCEFGLTATRAGDVEATESHSACLSKRTFLVSRMAQVSRGLEDGVVFLAQAPPARRIRSQTISRL
jgi:hypothetical protein